jgi:hypothetical protein
MPDVTMIRELRTQARIYNEAADVLEGKTPRTTPNITMDKPKRTLSAAARRRIAMGQKKRWALVHGGKKAA